MNTATGERIEALIERHGITVRQSFLDETLGDNMIRNESALTAVEALAVIQPVPEDDILFQETGIRIDAFRKFFVAYRFTDDTPERDLRSIVVPTGPAQGGYTIMRIANWNDYNFYTCIGETAVENSSI